MKAAPKSARAFERACDVIPGGVNSPVRAFGAVGGAPRFISHAAGSTLWDLDGNKFVDLVGSWGPMILGHGHPGVVHEVSTSLQQGLGFGAPTETESALAEEIRRRVAPVEKVRMVNSGTEAAMSAIRLARAATGKPIVVKFAGHYHGHVDDLLVSAGSGKATLDIADQPETLHSAHDTVVLPYNDPGSVTEVFDRLSDEIACVIVEAAAGNMGVVPPEEGFLDHLRALCSDSGALLITDEVMTGFRVHASGWYGHSGVPGDIFLFGKVMGGGLPAAAFAGPASLMDLLAPTGDVYQAGTLSGNPIAMTAGLATLRLAGPSTYDSLNENARAIQGMLAESLTRHGVAHQIQSAGSMFSVVFSEGKVVDFSGAKATETWKYPVFFHALLEYGLYVPPSPFESWFVNSAMTEEDLSMCAEAIEAAAQAVSSVAPPSAR